MTGMHNSALSAAQQLANASTAIDTIRSTFVKFVDDALISEGWVTSPLVKKLQNPIDGVSSNFSLQTSSGLIHATYSQAKRGSSLVGAYSFELLARDINGKYSAQRLRTMLFNQHGRATWTEDGEWEWEPSDRANNVYDNRYQFFFGLLADAQALLPDYPVAEVSFTRF